MKRGNSWNGNQILSLGFPVNAGWQATGLALVRSIGLVVGLPAAALVVASSGVLHADSTLKRASSWNWPDNSAVISDLDRYLSGKSAKNLALKDVADGDLGKLPAGASQTSKPSDIKTQDSNVPAPSPSEVTGSIDSPNSELSTAASLKGNALAELQSIRGWGLLERLVSIAANHEPSIASLVRRSEQGIAPSSYHEIESELDAVLASGGIPDWLKANMQLWVCRSLVQNALYDEAIDRLEQLPVESVSDPATLLFNLAVCQHHLLRKEDCLATLHKLLEREMDLPTRYAITARLMESDIKPLKEDSLDEISRMMNDVERRLTLGRTGKIVRDKQQAIVDKLDKSIDQFEQQIKEQQRQQQQQQQQQKSKNSAVDQPSQGSKISEVKGEGDVDMKDIGDGAGWGNLPPAQRQEALQNMTKDLPSHYRDVIEAYFKRLATTNE